MKERAPYMPWYGREFYSDINVATMSLEQQGAYLRLIWSCWQDSSIPADASKLAILCGCPADRFAADIWPAMRDLFTTSGDGRIIHRKVEEVRTAKEDFRVRQSAAGKAGNRRRWGNRESIAEPSPDDRQDDRQGVAKPSLPTSDLRLPISDFRKEEKTCSSGDERGGSLFPIEAKKAAKSRGDLTPEQDRWFSELWAMFWRLVSKKEARRAFGQQVKTAARFAEVVAAIRAQESEMLGRDPSKRPHLATWLRAERWTDEPADATPKRSDALTALYAELEQKQQETNVITEGS